MQEEVTTILTQYSNKKGYLTFWDYANMRVPPNFASVLPFIAPPESMEVVKRVLSMLPVRSVSWEF